MDEKDIEQAAESLGFDIGSRELDGELSFCVGVGRFFGGRVLLWQGRDRMERGGEGGRTRKE